MGAALYALANANSKFHPATGDSRAHAFLMKTQRGRLMADDLAAHQTGGRVEPDPITGGGSSWRWASFAATAAS
jgi:hypothetical protein